MPRFAANLSMMYTEHAFIERFAAAAADGFTAVEFLFPYEVAAATLAATLAQNRLVQVLFNAPPGDFTAGERGIAAAWARGRVSRRHRELIDSLGYTGWIGCEYRPAAATSAGLGWLPGRPAQPG